MCLRRNLHMTCMPRPGGPAALSAAAAVNFCPGGQARRAPPLCGPAGCVAGRGWLLQPKRSSLLPACVGAPARTDRRSFQQQTNHQFRCSVLERLRAPSGEEFRGRNRGGAGGAAGSAESSPFGPGFCEGSDPVEELYRVAGPLEQVCAAQHSSCTGTPPCGGAMAMGECHGFRHP